MPNPVLLVTLLALWTTGCGAECPSASQSGSCDLANSAADPGMNVQKLNLKPECEYVPTSLCTRSPSFACSLGGGDKHRYGYVLVVDQKGWDELSKSWSDSCKPTGIPTAWNGKVLLVASGRATESTEGSATHSLYRRGDGTPHVKVDFSFTFEDGCDCETSPAVGLVIETDKKPLVCLKAKSTCKE